MTINYQTAGAVNGMSNGLGTASAGSQSVTVNGNVYQAAVGSATSPVQLANQRVGGGNTAVVTVANTASGPSGYVEDLNASYSSASGQASGSGSISGRLAGTNNTGTGAITVGVDTSSAGAKTGSVTINYQTAGAVNGTSNTLGTASAGSQSVTVNGNVYNAAVGQLNTVSYNFGTIQVGQNSTPFALSISNAAAAGAYSEDLKAQFGTAGDTRIEGTGQITGLLAGGTDTTTMSVRIVGTSAGNINAVAIPVNFFTTGKVNGSAIAGLSEAAAGSANFSATVIIQGGGQVIDQANPVINNSPINLGNVRVGIASPVGFVSVTNQASGNNQAALNASISGNAPITASGSFNLLASGADQHDQPAGRHEHGQRRRHQRHGNHCLCFGR